VLINDGQSGPVVGTRIVLGEYFNDNADPTAANCDPEAALVLDAINQLLQQHTTVKRVVLAVDAPLLSLPRDLPMRTRNPVAGTLDYRQPEEQLLANGLQAGPAEWRVVCPILPGAPLCSRVSALVAGLVNMQFQPYIPGQRLGQRILVECFPSEAIWSLGIRGRYGNITPSQARAYKEGGGGWLPWPQALHLLHENLIGFIPAIGMDGQVVAGWIGEISHRLLLDTELIDQTGLQMRMCKLFDDAIDSANCMFTAVAFAKNAAHVWVGENPYDGHIVGPGR